MFKPLSPGKHVLKYSGHIPDLSATPPLLGEFMARVFTRQRTWLRLFPRRVAVRTLLLARRKSSVNKIELGSTMSLSHV